MTFDGFGWVDVEATGLEESDLLLEIAIVATDQDLEEQARIQFVIKPPLTVDFDAVIARMDPYVRDMHTRSGLLEESRLNGYPLANVDQVLTMWLKEHFPGAVFAGATPTYDRRMIRHWMPELERAFHYRCFDVSTLKRAYRAWVGEFPSAAEAGKRHRAMPDILGAIDEARAIRSWMQGRQPTRAEEE